MDKTPLEIFEEAVVIFANQHSIERLKISTYDFDYDFKRGQDGAINLVGLKAVVRVLGHTSKVPIGAEHEHQTYESAFEATKKHWSEYYRAIRAKRSPEQKAAEVRRQLRYRARRKQSAAEFKRLQ